MQIYYFLYLCLGQTIIQVMEIDNQSVDYRPLILVAEDDDSNFKLIKAIICLLYTSDAADDSVYV